MGTKHNIPTRQAKEKAKPERCVVGCWMMPVSRAMGPGTEGIATGEQ